MRRKVTLTIPELATTLSYPEPLVRGYLLKGEPMPIDFAYRLGKLMSLPIEHILEAASTKTLGYRPKLKPRVEQVRTYRKVGHPTRRLHAQHSRLKQLLPKNKSLRWLSIETGITYAFLWKMNQGQKPLSENAAIKIANALLVSVEKVKEDWERGV